MASGVCFESTATETAIRAQQNAKWLQKQRSKTKTRERRASSGFALHHHHRPSLVVIIASRSYIKSAAKGYDYVRLYGIIYRFRRSPRRRANRQPTTPRQHRSNMFFKNANKSRRMHAFSRRFRFFSFSHPCVCLAMFAVRSPFVKGGNELWFSKRKSWAINQSRKLLTMFLFNLSHNVETARRLTKPCNCK